MVELLQYTNLLLIPAVAYIVKLEGRIGRLEMMLEIITKDLQKHEACEERVFTELLHERERHEQA